MLHSPIRRPAPQNREGKVLLGCLVALGAVMILAITATVITVLNWRNIVSKGLTVGFDQIIEQLPIDESERDEIGVHIDRLVGEYKNKNISFEELFEVFETLAASPAIPAGIVTGAHAMYIESSELSDEEKLDAGVQLQRFAHGIYTEKIDPAVIGELLEPLHAEDGAKNTITLGVQLGTSGKQEMKIVAPDGATIEQLQEVLAIARAKADEFEIEAVVPTIDLSDEIGIAVDQAVGSETALPPVPDTEP
jgi:hypothetical protein